MFLVLGFRGAWVSHARLESQGSAGLRMQPFPRCPDLVWPGHLHGTGCLSARAMDTGFPTVVWRLCLGRGCAWIWVSVTPPPLAGVLGGCVRVRFVVSPLFSPLGFAVFAVGLGFQPAPHLSWLGFWNVRGCVRAPPAPRRYRFWCAVWACVLGSGFRLHAASPWGGVVGVCVRSCVCPACPRHSWGAACGAGVCGCCRWWGVPPPPPLRLFFLGGALWCPSLVVPVLGLVVSVPPSLLFRAALFAVRVFLLFSSVVCVRVFWVSLLPVGRCPRLGVACFGWVVPRRPFGGSCLRCRLVGGFGRLLWCWWAAWWLWAVLAPPPPLPVVFFPGGVCLFLPLPSLGWRTHWSAFRVVFLFAVGGCVLPGRAPAPSVGWVMYTLGSAPLPAGLGSGSAGWAVVPGGFVWPWVSRIPSSPRCRFSLSGGGLCGWTATVVAGRAVASCRCVAGWCGSFRGVRWLDLVRPSVSVPCLVLRCVVVRRAASCRVLTCCVVLVCAVLRCALLGRAVLRRVAPWCAALCRSLRALLWRVVLWGALSCCVALWCAAVRCAVLPRVVLWWVGGG